MQSSSPAPSTTWCRAWLITTLLVLVGSASAYDGLTLGLSGGPPTGDGYALNVRAVQPIATTPVRGTPIQLSARADLATPLSFDTVPAVGISAITSSEAEGVERYLGVGTGASFPSTDDGTLWSVYGLAGYRVPLTARLHAALEVHVTANALFSGPQMGVALEYSFGGGR